MKRSLGFAVVIAGITLLGGFILALLFSEPRSARAVWTSAALAFAVQLATYAIARRYARTGDVMKGWGIGALMRVGALALYGFVAPTVLGLPLAPALLSFTVLLFISTVIEPLFLAA